MANQIERADFIADFLPGARASIKIERRSPTPAAILDIEDKLLRQRAMAAWKAAVRLEQVIELWSQFKTLGAHGLRLDRESEARIRKLYPKLKDLGGILDVLAPQERSPAQQTDHVKEMEQIAGIKRGPTNKRTPAEQKQLLGRGLVELIAAFRRLMIGDSRVLHLAGLQSKFFGQSEREVVDAITEIMRINTDSSGDGPPVDFSAAIKDLKSCRLLAGIKGELARVKMLLEDSPTILLASTVPEKAPRLAVVKTPEFALDGKIDDLSQEAVTTLIPNRLQKGGRPRKWVELIELAAEMKQANPAVSRETVCAAYNKRYGRAINSGKKSKATPRILSSVLYDYTNRKRAQPHE